jgi:S1-C subfamily serine protease
MSANKIFIVVLVLLVLFTGALAYYAYTLNGNINILNDRLVAFNNEQSASFQAVSDNISALKNSTDSSLTVLQSQAAAASSAIGSLKTDISAASQNIGALDKRIGAAEAGVSGLSDTIPNIPAVYQKVVRTVVRITNGQAESGSGFVYDSSGRVVTAYHVVSSLATIYVMLYDGRVSRATLLGYSDISDVAVLKLDFNPSIEPPQLADSSKIQIGQTVLVIGSPGDTDEPLGLKDTLTSGVVSQLNRYIIVENNATPNLIQVDAPVNFGNSGGPLFDTSGRVVGIADARIDPTQGDGISYAISSNKVKRVADSIISKGSFPYPYLGVNLVDITPLQVTQKGLPSANGALVTVAPGGPAATAGVQTGDVIVSIDGVAVNSVDDLTSYLGEYKSPADSAILELLRGSGKINITVTVGLRPAGG